MMLEGYQAARPSYGEESTITEEVTQPQLGSHPSEPCQPRAGTSEAFFLILGP